MFAHGVNCRGGFGSGIAGQIVKKHPEVRDDYLKKAATLEGWKLGDVQLSGKIFNCATQNNYGYDGKKYCSYDAIETCLRKAKKHCSKFDLQLGLPKIGCGLAGGNWKVVHEIIKDGKLLIDEKFSTIRDRLKDITNG